MAQVIGRGRYATATYPDGLRSTGGGQAQTHFFWVNGDTTVPLAQQTGAPATPFATIQQAVERAVEESVGVRVYLIGDGGDLTVPDFLNVDVLGIQGSLSSVVLGSGSVVSTRDAALSNMVSEAPGSTGGRYSASFTDYTVGQGQNDVFRNADIPNSSLSLSNAGCFGDIVCGSLVATGTCLRDGTSITAGTFRLQNCAFNAAVPVTVTSTGVLATCEFDGASPFTNGVPLQVDSYTDSRMTSAGVTNTGGRAVIG